MEGHTQFVSLDWTLIFQWGNLLILYLIIKKFLFGPIQKMLSDRENEVKSMYDSAEKAEKDAISMKEEYTAHLAGAKDEANEILKNANQRATLKPEEMLREAQVKANGIVAKAGEEIELEKKRAFAQVKGEISDLALMAASKVVERELSSEEHERLMDQFIDSVGDAPWQK